MRPRKAYIIGFLFLSLSGCVHQTPSAVHTIIQPKVEPVQHGSPEQTQLELRVLDALSDDFLKGVRFEVEAHLVVVTVFTSGDSFSENQLEKYRIMAETVTNGIPVAIVIDESEPPSQD